MTIFLIAVRELLTLFVKRFFFKDFTTVAGQVYLAFMELLCLIFFVSGCSAFTPTMSLGDDISCHLYDTCTGVVCCLTSTRLDRTFKIHFELDPCMNNLKIGIEKYQFDFSLFEFEYETEKIFHLDRVVQIL